MVFLWFQSIDSTMALFGVVLPVDDADAAHRDPEFADGPRRAAVAPDFVPQSGDQTWILP